MKKKKTLIWLLGGSAALLLVLGTTLYLQNQRINALDTAGSSGGKSEELAPAGGGDDTPISTGSPQTDTPDEDEGSTGGRRIQVGTVVPEGSAELPEVPADGTVKVHEVSLPEGALDWSKPMQEPQVNDIIEIEVLPDKRYEFKVTSVSIYEEPRKVVVLGKLLNCNGAANMMLLSGKMLLQINDQDTPIIYNLYFDQQNDKYIVQEINPEKKAKMTPSDHSDEQKAASTTINQLQVGSTPTKP